MRAADRWSMKPTKKPQKREPQSDSGPEMPVLDKKPSERTPKEIREAIEADAILERRDEHSH